MKKENMDIIHITGENDVCTHKTIENSHHTKKKAIIHITGEMIITHATGENSLYT